MNKFNYSQAIKSTVSKIQTICDERDPSGFDTAHYYASDFEAGYYYADGGGTNYEFETMQETYSYLQGVLTVMLEVEAETSI